MPPRSFSKVISSFLRRTQCLSTMVAARAFGQLKLLTLAQDYCMDFPLISED